MKYFLHNKGHRRSKKGGYMLLLAMLVSSILLAIALGIHSIGLKEIMLASFAKNSEVAIAAADRGLECGLYWDAGYPQNGRRYTVFATSTGGGGYGEYRGAGIGSEPGGVLCQTGAGAVDISSVWTHSGAGNKHYETKFSYDLSNGSCTSVTVIKDLLGVAPNEYQQSEIIARGFNLPCAETTNVTNLNTRLIQRILDVKLKF